MFINPLVISHGSDAGEYVISVRAENHVSSVSDSVMVMVAPSVPHITIEALGSVCLVGEPCLFAAKLSNGTLAPQGNFIYKWSNQVGGWDGYWNRNKNSNYFARARAACSLCRAMSFNNVLLGTGASIGREIKPKQLNTQKVGTWCEKKGAGWYLTRFD